MFFRSKHIVAGILTFTISMAAVHTAIADQVWNFESGIQSWAPRPSIVLQHTPGVVAVAGSTASLRVQGVAQSNTWNYTTSPWVPILPGQWYRLSVWVRVDLMGTGPTEATLPPYIKVEFVGVDPTTNMNVSLGRINTSLYDTTRMSQWQLLTREFQTPSNATQIYLALEKGAPDPMRIDAYIDNAEVIAISAVDIGSQYTLAAAPRAKLDEFRLAHPRLLLSRARVDTLRQAIQIGGSHAHLWPEIEKKADSYVSINPPSYTAGITNDEQLWQRTVGDALPYLAMAYVLTQKQPYLDAVKKWASASASYPTWGMGANNGKGLAAGHQLLGLALVYDWCYDALDVITRTLLLDTLRTRGQTMFQAGALGEAWWHNNYLQNHLWVNTAGLAAAGFAIFDDANNGAIDPYRWIGLTLDKMQRTRAALGSDGTSHEGMGYWQYGATSMLKFMHPARELLNVDLYDTPWWRNTARYPLYLGLPRHAWTVSNLHVDIADSPRYNWYGPDFLLRALAREYRDGTAQWLADAQDNPMGPDLNGSVDRWLNLIWFDPTIAALAPTTAPTLYHFTDMGIVSSRSDWSGDESLLVFKSGPFIGHHAMDIFSYDPGSGHVHPDANHFVLFGNGEWLVADDGYRGKATDQHNTLLVKNDAQQWQGQIGEGGMWFSGISALMANARPRILQAQSDSALDYTVGEAASAYSAGLGLTRFARHLLYLKPDVLVVVDDIALFQERGLELRFHPEHEAILQVDGSFAAGCTALTGQTLPKTCLRVEPLTPQGVQTASGLLPARDSKNLYTELSKMNTIQFTTQGTRWRNATAFSWSPFGIAPTSVAMSELSPDVWRFTAAGKMVELDLARNAAAVVAADLDISINASTTSVVSGGEIFYTITATNNSAFTVRNVTMTSQLPTGFNWVSTQASQGNCTGTDAINCVLGNLAAGASAILKISATSYGIGNFTTTSQVSAVEFDPNPANNTATTTVTVTVPPYPAIDGFWKDPSSPKVYLFGKNFLIDGVKPIVKFSQGTLLANVRQVSATQVMVLEPLYTKVGRITLKTPIALTISPTAYKAIQSGLTINGFSPTEAKAGAIGYIFGSGFSTTQANQVSINGVPAAFVQAPDSALLVYIVPAGASTGLVKVTTGGVTATSSTNLVIVP